MGDAEAAAHAARRYVRDCRHRRVLLKIERLNAFNSPTRDLYLSVMQVRKPSFYSHSSVAGLVLSNQTIIWWKGVCLRDMYAAGRPNWTSPLCSNMVDEATQGAQLEFNVWYWEDAALSVCLNRFHDELVVLLERLKAFDLEINARAPFSTTSCRKQQSALHRALFGS